MESKLGDCLARLVRRIGQKGTDYGREYHYFFEEMDTSIENKVRFLIDTTIYTKLNGTIPHGTLMSALRNALQVHFEHTEGATDEK